MKKNTLKENLFKALPVILISTLLVFIIIYAWTEPPQAPPQGNVPAPLNVGPSGQAKQGGLILNTSDTPLGLIVQYGNVGIGTTRPSYRLGVNGEIRTQSASGIVFSGFSACPLQVGAAPSFSNVQVFTTSGTFTVPPGVTRVWIEVYGGGGGGGSGNTGFFNPTGGGGGGAGGVAMGFVNVTPGENIPVIVGRGGAGGSFFHENGSAGGSSSFSTIRATGGEGGYYNGWGGGGGRGIGGIINQVGGGGESGHEGGPGGNGGSNTRGSGGRGAFEYNRAEPGSVFGGGGGGGYELPGAPGGDGAVIIWY